MKLSDDEVYGLNVALNEATWLGLSIDPEGRRAAATLAVLSLPEVGPPPDDRRVQLLMQPLGRIAVSHRQGRWNDEAAPVLRLTLSELERLTVEHPTNVYGWDFFNEEFRDPVANWRQPLSLDLSLDPVARSISLDLHHDSNAYLAVRLWFDAFRIFTPNREEIELAAFIEAGKRWWDGLSGGDPRTEGSGIYPLKPSDA
jgi:hypothetical protein